VTSNQNQRSDREPLYDIVPETGVSIEVFYSDRTLETFGRGGAGWFWWPRRIGLSPDGSATGPFATSYAAYRHAMTTPATANS
jgi:type 1 fimbria pilin